MGLVEFVGSTVIIDQISTKIPIEGCSKPSMTLVFKNFVKVSQIILLLKTNMFFPQDTTMPYCPQVGSQKTPCWNARGKNEADNETVI